MYEFIRGNLIECSSLWAVVECGGIGYKVAVPSNYERKLLGEKGELLFYTSHVVRENFHALYGFLSRQERDLFEVLIGVSGLGPKTGLSLIGTLGIETVVEAIRTSDFFVLSKTPGIGKKTAERLVIEVRDKLPSLMKEVDISLPFQQEVDQTTKDAMNALLNLGYTQMTAQKAIEKALVKYPESEELAVIITEALKNV